MQLIKRLCFVGFALFACVDAGGFVTFKPWLECKLLAKPEAFQHPRHYLSAHPGCRFRTSATPVTTRSVEHNYPLSNLRLSSNCWTLISISQIAMPMSWSTLINKSGPGGHLTATRSGLLQIAPRSFSQKVRATNAPASFSLNNFRDILICSSPVNKDVRLMS